MDIDTRIETSALHAAAANTATSFDHNRRRSEHGYVNKYIRKVPVPDGQTKIDADREAAAAAASKLSEFGLRVQLGLA